MNEELRKKADAGYRLAEQKAAEYYQSLDEQVRQKTYVSTLIKDIQSWKQNHIHHSLLSLFLRRRGKPDSRDYHNYIKWLDYTGKLDHYLDRSISYIFLRDLGKRLDSSDTKTRVRRVVDNLKSHLTTDRGDKAEMFSMARLYRMAQKEGIESTMIWLMNKLKTVSTHIPKGMDAEQAQRKLIKIIAGVMMHEVEEMGDEISTEERTQKLDKAMRLGYSYGLTYPFIDDLLDSGILSDKEKKQYSDLIRTTLITGSVPKLGEWTGKNKGLIRFIHSELKAAFEYIKAHQRQATISSFFEQSYVFFNSQEVDRVK
ncbi:polyprenyl synthetase family protein, partial [Bacillus sp. JJ1503]